MSKKITILGAGNVGATVAYTLTLESLATAQYSAHKMEDWGMTKYAIAMSVEGYGRYSNGSVDSVASSLFDEKGGQRAEDKRLNAGREHLSSSWASAEKGCPGLCLPAQPLPPPWTRAQGRLTWVLKGATPKGPGLGVPCPQRDSITKLPAALGGRGDPETVGGQSRVTTAALDTCSSFPGSAPTLVCGAVTRTCLGRTVGSRK